MSNIPRFGDIVQTCDGNHAHAPWQVFRSEKGTTFDTSSEAEYPAALCYALSKLILDLAIEHGFVPKQKGNLEVEARRAARGVAASKQPRGSRFPRLLPEYGRIASVHPGSLDLKPFVGKPLSQEIMILLDLPGCSGRLLELREKQGDSDQQIPEAKIGILEENAVCKKRLRAEAPV
jgi:hypothetical protein